MTLEELVTKYTFDIDTKPLENLKEQLSESLEWTKRLGEAMAVAAETIFEWTRETAQAGEEALHMSEALGINIEKLQELGYVAKLAGLDQQQMGMSLGLLARHMTDASQGSAQSMKAFKAIGISVDQIRGRKPDEVLGLIADRFHAMGPSAARTAGALELLGRGGKNWIPILGKGSAEMNRFNEEARESGYILSGEQAEAGEKFIETMRRMFAQLVGLRNLVGLQIMPVVQKAMEAFIGWVKVNRQLIQSSLLSFLRTLMAFVQNAWQMFKALYTVTNALLWPLGGLAGALRKMIDLMLIFVGMQMLSGLGSMYLAIIKLIEAYQALSKWQLLTNVLAAAWPIFIGAIIALVLLMIEDIYQFFAGGESILGNIVNAIKAMWSWFEGWFSSKMTALGNMMKDWAKDLASYMIAFFQPFVDFMKGIGDGMKAMAKGDFSGVANLAKGLIGFGDASSTSTPVSAPASGGGVSSNQTNQVQLHQTINVGPGADPVAVGRRVENGTSSALDTALRGANRAFNPAGVQ